MSKKLVASGIGALMFAVPFVSSAYDISRSCGSEDCPSSTVQVQIDALLKQVAQLQAQIAVLVGQQDGTLTPGHEAAICVSLANTLSVGSTDAMTGGEVSKLQAFLMGQSTVSGDPIYPERLETGYFGQATSRAVQKWQTANGIAITTPGVGIVGPKTRAAMTAKCNRAPVISSISGPTSLVVNQTGTWSLHATDPESNPLQYVVRWGDEPSQEDVVYPFNWPALGFATAYTSSTFSHSYSASGTYQVIMAVTDVNQDFNHAQLKTLTVIVH